MKKKFRTYEEQLKILKNRGLIIEDENFAKKVLKEENYYNVINGYKDLFVNYDSEEETYNNGSTFEEIHCLYEFDRSLRDIFMSNILKVENTLRSLIAYNFSKSYGEDNYLKFENFETLRGVTNQRDALENRAKRIQTLISRMQREIGDSINKKEYIKHYVIDHGYVPLWVLVNTISLGTLSDFYSLMKQNDKRDIAIHYNLKDSDLLEYIRLLAFYRNLCAHDERFYNAKTYRKCTIPNNIYHEMLSIPLLNNQYVYGKEDVFALVITLKILLPAKDFINMFNKLNGRIESLQTKINYLNINDILEKMGFPVNWKEIKNLNL